MPNILQGALKVGLADALVVLALFLSYSMLNVCDLSTDGCYTLGALVGTLVAMAGHPWLSIPAAMLAGAASGLVTAVLQTKMGVQSLLAGIVVNTGMYSVNMALSGFRPNLAMPSTGKLRVETIFTKAYDFLKAHAPQLTDYSIILVLLMFVTLVVLFLIFFLRTKLGLAIRATGSNADMVRSSSINPAFTTIVGLCVSNSFTALSGCLFAQQTKSYNVNMGGGIVTVALASLLIGGVIFGKHRAIPLRALGAVLGAFIFRLVYSIALQIPNAVYMVNAISSIIVIIAISGPYLKERFGIQMKRWRTGKEGGEAAC
ncbi:MAG: ABC transporter permease [Clostridia bacterium]|nr:ABC transporter permease [Clostridia bacterium]